jgi:exosortase/archaeosortase family protein
MAFVGAVSVLGVVRATGLERPAAIRVGTWTAAVAYAVLWPAQAGTDVAANVLSTPHGRLRVAENCSGFDLLGLLAAAMLAYPVAWRRRLAGIALLVPFVFTVNVIRVASLSLVLEHAPGAFETMHAVVWQGLLILAGLAYWLVWSATEPSTA